MERDIAYTFPNRIEKHGNIIIAGMYLCALGIICRFGGGILPIVLAVIMLYLGITDKYYTIWPVTVIMNDALGTIIGGKGSFIWLLLIINVFGFLLRNRNDRKYVVDKRFLLLCMIMLLWTSYEMIFQARESTDFIYKTLPFVISFFPIYKDIKIDNNLEVEDVLLHVSLSAFILICATVFWGKTSINESYIVRQGLLGTGVGDPNYSANKIVLAITILLLTPKIKWKYKIPVIAICVYMLGMTVSVTGFIALAVALLLTLTLEQSFSQKVTRVLLVFSALFVALYFVVTSNILSTIPSLSGLYSRISILNGSTYVHGTEGGSGRVGLAIRYITAFFNEIPAVNMMLGGVSLPNDLVAPYYSHNTYLDCLFRYGLIGTFFILFTIVKQIRTAILSKERVLIGAKIVVFLFSFSISIYSGDVAAIWFVLLLML